MNEADQPPPGGPFPPPLQAAQGLECQSLSLGCSPASSPPELSAAEEVEESGDGSGEHELALAWKTVQNRQATGPLS